MITDKPVSAEVRRQVEQFRAKRLGDEEWCQKLLGGNHEARRELALMSYLLNAEVEQ
jgi:hypothetical protein